LPGQLQRWIRRLDVRACLGHSTQAA